MAFASECLEAYEVMNQTGSVYDYMVCRLPEEKGVDKLITLSATGRGGLQACKKVLEERFIASVGVALFRVTSVDGVSNASVRCKLVHVIFVGKDTPPLLRAKANSQNAQLKAPFSKLCSAYVQIVGDISELDEEFIITKLGGHGTKFDFENLASGGVLNSSALVVAVAEPAQMPEVKVVDPEVLNDTPSLPTMQVVEPEEVTLPVSTKPPLEQKRSVRFKDVIVEEIVFTECDAVGVDSHAHHHHEEEELPPAATVVVIPPPAEDDDDDLEQEKYYERIKKLSNLSDDDK